LIQTSKVIGIQKYVFFSIYQCDRYPDIPLMSIKACTEVFIKSTNMDYTIFRLCGFMQAIIGNYAVPILENRTVWGTNENTQTAYVDTQDIAKMTISSLSRSDTNGFTLTILGPKAWTTQEVIELCETFSRGSKAKVVKVPVWFLKATRNFLSYFQSARDAADRLAFSELSSGNFIIDKSSWHKII